jgi:hypothetical protein
MSKAPQADAAPKRLGLRLAPALAGGRLRDFNRVLWLVFEARQRGTNWQPCLVLDPALDTRADRDLWLLDAQGNPCRLHGAEDGVFQEHGRAALLAAAQDRMPGTAEAEPTLQSLMPRPGDRPVDAALELWQSLLPSACGLQVCVAGSEAKIDAWLDPAQGPRLTWVGPRHQQVMRELGIEVESVMRGETALTEELTLRHAGQVRSQAKAMEAELERGLASLKAAVQSEAPGLLGSWNRYRRAARKAAAEFRRSNERFDRNRKGIRGNRLHALAQGLRPHEGEQENSLGLLCAMALFRLQAARAVEHLDVFHDALKQGSAIVFIRAGISASPPLS